MSLIKHPVSSVFWACFLVSFGLVLLSIVLINMYMKHYYSRVDNVKMKI